MVKGRAFYPSSKDAQNVIDSLIVAEGESHINRATRILRCERKRVFQILNGTRKMSYSEWKLLNEIVEGEK